MISTNQSKGKPTHNATVPDLRTLLKEFESMSLPEQQALLINELKRGKDLKDILDLTKYINMNFDFQYGPLNETPLVTAIKAGCNSLVIGCILNKTKDVNMRGQFGHTPLFALVERNDFDAFVSLSPLFQKGAAQSMNIACNSNLGMLKPWEYARKNKECDFIISNRLEGELRKQNSRDALSVEDISRTGMEEARRAEQQRSLRGQIDGLATGTRASQPQRPYAARPTLVANNPSNDADGMDVSSEDDHDGLPIPNARRAIGGNGDARRRLFAGDQGGNGKPKTTTFSFTKFYKDHKFVCLAGAALAAITTLYVCRNTAIVVACKNFIQSKISDVISR